MNVFKKDYVKMTNDKFEKVLLKDFPEMFVYMNNNEELAPIFYGVDSPKGWNKIIYECTKELYNYCKQNKLDFPIVVQIKEKFFGLRYYLETVEDDNIRGILSKYEEMSFNYCMNCGEELKDNHVCKE